MGREIRRVPLNWEHPKRTCPHSPWQGGCDEAKKNGGRCFQPMHDRDYETAAKAWKEEFFAWEKESRFEKEGCEFWEYYGLPPEREFYRPKWESSEMIGFQVYETVSEGSPVTPVFTTKEELVDYLVECGDFWEHGRAAREQRAPRGWSRERAESFLKDEWAPSMVVTHNQNSIVIETPEHKEDYGK